MAHHHHHTHPVTPPRWAARSLTTARRWEARAERHWPFVAYALLSLATAAYVIGQLARIA